MPFKHQIIEFMRKKASFLPVEVRNAYFDETDEDAIKDLWSSKEARRVCHAIKIYIEKDEITDSNMCPFCLKDDGKCDKCGYFQNHGCCHNPHSTYLIVLDHIYGGVKCNKGIMEYITETHGQEILNELKSIVTKTKLVSIEKQ